jgi:hypothetical protein
MPPLRMLPRPEHDGQNPLFGELHAGQSMVVITVTSFHVLRAASSRVSRKTSCASISLGSCLACMLTD